MKWKDKLWTAYRVIVNTTVDVTVSTLNAVGSMACMIGGAGFALSFASENLKPSYYGSAVITGIVDLSIDIVELNYNLNQTIPIQHNIEYSGKGIYALGEYLPPQTIQSASMMLTASGMLLHALSANIKQWRTKRDEAMYLENHFGADYQQPSLLKKHLYLNAASMLSSLSLIALGNTLTMVLINTNGSSNRVSYPAQGNKIVTPDYEGPVTSTLISAGLSLANNVSVKLPFGVYSVQEIVAVQAQANLTYGADLDLAATNPANLSPLVPAAMYCVTSSLCSFFNRKLTRIHYEELQAENSYEVV
ncbi:MAG TPA: hypothetical protein PK657_14545 [Legionella sp.]|nr:hypothetical protein [Legionella sp.]